MLQKLKSQKFLSMVTSVLGAAFALLTFGYLARALTKEEFGIYGIYLAIITTFEMLRNGLVGKPFIKFMAESDDEEEKRGIIGSSWAFSFLSTLVFAGPLSLAMLAWYIYQPSEEVLVYALFIPIQAISTIPSNMAQWRLNADLRFDLLIWLRLSNQVFNFVGVLWAYYFGYGLWAVMWITIISNFNPSWIALIFDWDGLRQIRRAQKEWISRLYKFGRYTMGTLIGGTLLRGSDDFLIRIFMGPEAVALYQVPNRLVNLIDIPLRALVSFSFPSLARSNKSGDDEAFKREFEAATAFAFVLLLPMAIGAFIFAEPLVLLMGGEKYLDSAIILRIFAIFMAFSALDRYAGVGLDVLNRPQINMRKVIVMLSVNIIGDILVLYFFESLPWVAAISIITFSVGTLLGFYYMRDRVPLRLLFWLKLGTVQILNFVKKPVRK
ncbi:lipopolysaccharide biosynthesis protein [Croceimicrobium sp.]|uniref:lipopolysaccharide biosynthesis protein n=1 Tax=Croceimicrobium sp. TaxID=2828340 RepID=UPI003BACF879